MEPSWAVLEACKAMLAAVVSFWAVSEALESPREAQWPPRDHRE